MATKRKAKTKTKAKPQPSALERAIAERRPDDELNALILAGADVKPVKDRIVWAVRQPLPVLERFLAAGAPINLRAIAGTPVQVAARFGLLAHVQRLLAGGAKPDLGTMIGNPLADAIEHGHTECALALLAAGATPAAAERFRPVLAGLIERRDVTLVRAFLEHGADVDARVTLSGPHPRDRTNPTAALDALDADDDSESFEEFEARANAAIEAGLDTMTTVRLANVTPLMIAAGEGSLEIVELLLARRPALDLFDDAGRTARAIAAAAGHRAIEQRLRAAGAAADVPIPPDLALLIAAEQGDVPGIQRAVKRGASVDVHDRRATTRGETPLHRAIAGGHAAAVRALLALGAKLERKRRKSADNVRAFLNSESQVRTPLHAAAARGDVEIATILLEAGASADARDEEDATPLDLATEHQHAAMVALLRKKRRG